MALQKVASAFLVVATVAVAAPVAAAAAEPAAMVGGTGDIVDVASTFVAEAKFGTAGFGLVVVVAAAATYLVSEATDVKSAAAKHHPALNLFEIFSVLGLNCLDPERKIQKHDEP